MAFCVRTSGSTMKCSLNFAQGTEINVSGYEAWNGLTLARTRSHGLCDSGAV